MQWTDAQFYEWQDGVLTCTLCPHNCRLEDTQTGLCHVRRRRGDRLETATFGTSVRHFNPIERKPFYHFHPGSTVLTLAAPGCSLTCHYCQNYRISQYGRLEGAHNTIEPVDVDEVVSAAADRRAAVGLSYSEPSLAAELTLALAEAGRERGVPILWKTNGFVTKSALRRLAPHLAAVNLDLKAPSDASHRKLTGVALQPVLETMDQLLDAGVWVEISTPVIPTFNADSDSIDRIARLIFQRSASIPWHLLRFTPEFRFASFRPTQIEELVGAQEIARDVGLHFVYVERALGAGGRRTCCSVCQSDVIERSLDGVVHSKLVNRCCPACGHEIAGIW
jgi:pyruvate formate lyase activating enzyme